MAAAAADWLPNDLFGLILRLNMDALSGVNTAYYYYTTKATSEESDEGNQSVR